MLLNKLLSWLQINRKSPKHLWQTSETFCNSFRQSLFKGSVASLSVMLISPSKSRCCLILHGGKWIKFVLCVNSFLGHQYEFGRRTDLLGYSIFISTGVSFVGILLPRVLPGHVRGLLKSCAKFACSLIHFLLTISSLRTHELTLKQESNIIRQRKT